MMMMRMLTAVVVVAAAMMSAAEGQGSQSCVSKLADCVDSINSAKPAKECCDSIKIAVATELTCLCSIYNTPGILQTFNVSVPQALNLTTNCGVPVTLDQCNSTASSPTSQNSPPGVTGNDNGAERTAIAGIFIVFMFFVSTLFY